jgi:hypothetical protein
MMRLSRCADLKQRNFLWLWSNGRFFGQRSWFGGNGNYVIAAYATSDQMEEA